MSNTNRRMGFHLMPKTGSLNDPSGITEYKGTYHVFCQANPEWPAEGAKCWSHFSSSDLVNWKSEPVAVQPDSAADAQGSYPGCVHLNAKTQTLDVYYTGTVKAEGDYDYVHEGRTSNVIRMRSKDGKEFGPKEVLLSNEDYPDFVTQVVRCPDVWADASRLHMILGARDTEDNGVALLYESLDGDTWTYQRALRTDEPFGYVWENPNRMVLGEWDFLSTNVQGLEHTQLSNQNVYSAGYFWSGQHVIDTDVVDTATFTEWDQGFDFYSPETFVDSHGRTILMGWMGMPGASYANHPEDASWEGCLSVPRRVFFVPDPEGNDCIRQEPVEELDALRGESRELVTMDETHVSGLRADIVIRGISSRSGSVTINDEVTFSFGNYRTHLRFAEDGVAGAGRTRRNGVLVDNGAHDLRILVDDSAIEVYVDGGSQVFSTRWFPEEEDLAIWTDIEADEAVVYAMGDGMKGVWEE